MKKSQKGADMLETFRIEGFSREEIEEKLRKRNDYHDAYQVRWDTVKPKGLVRFFKKPHFVATYVIKPSSPEKRQAVESAKAAISEKRRSMSQTPSAAREVLRKSPIMKEMADVKKAMAIIENRNLSELMPPQQGIVREPELIRSPAIQVQVKIDQDEKFFMDFLRDRDLDEGFVTELMSSIRQLYPAPAWRDEDFCRKAVQEVIGRFIRIHKGVKAPAGEKSHVMFVGPTGVGKTTTLVKVSTPFYQKRKSIRYITNDDYRIGAADQLKCYAEIMGIPIDVVNNPEQFNERISAAQEELLFLDTAGRNPRDIAKIGELLPLVDCLGEKKYALEIFLVLAANMQMKDMQQIVRNFSGISLSGIIFTKIDEAVTLGSMFNVLQRTKIPLAYTAHGQGVPEDLSAVDEKHLADLIFREQ
jgi:flagellar biosynthesis protein FlhF